MAESIQIANIRTDGGTQPRTSLYEETVAEYREAMEAGSEFPPVIVFHDGSDYWLADGFHRFHASKQAGIASIASEIHQGTRRDAVLYSVGANHDHGLRRTNKDKRNAVMVLLQDDEWCKWSDREIARQCGVSPQTVNNCRSSLTVQNGQLEGEPRTYTTKHGTEATMNTSNIGGDDRQEGYDEPVPTNDNEDENEEAKAPKEPEKPKSKGMGLRAAYEAIAALKRIPLNDGLRQDAFDKVIDWIETNRSN